MSLESNNHQISKGNLVKGFIDPPYYGGAIKSNKGVISRYVYPRVETYLKRV
jgi:hypothetical protein